MFILYDQKHDITNQLVEDRYLAVNSCGVNASVSRGRRLSDTMYVRRPDGRQDYQLLYVSMGQARHMLEGSWQTVRAGEAVLYRPGEPQMYTYEANTPARCHWVHFSGSGAEELLCACGMGKGTLFQVGEDREISQLFSRMVQEYQLKQRYHEQVSAALLNQIIALMGRNRRAQTDRAGYQTRQKLRGVVDYMNDHYTEPQSVSQYAERCGMDRYRFIHAFKECVGQSPYAFLTALRMARASELLSGSLMPVKEIAADCGYENPLYFSRAFSRHFGMPPTEYRKTHQPAREENENATDE